MRSRRKARLLSVALPLASFALLPIPGCQGELRLDDAPTADSGLMDLGTVMTSDAPGDAHDVQAPTSGCKTDTDCHLSTLHCDVPSGSCVECIGDLDCTAGPNHRCDAALHQCVQCGVDGDCQAGQVCEIAARRCVTSCQKITDCLVTGYVCDITRDICVRCIVNATCLDPDIPVCAPDGTCVQCSSDSQCTGTTPVCNEVTGGCVQCVAASDCPSASPLCDPASHTCTSG